MTNFLIFPEINDENGFPSEVNRAIAQSPEMQAEMDERLGGSDATNASFIADPNSATHRELKATIGQRVKRAAFSSSDPTAQAPAVTMLPNPVARLGVEITSIASIYWPSVLNVSGESWALDTYYMLLTTDHGAGGIALLTAPSPAGPWTDRGIIYVDTVAGGSTETAHAVYNPVTDLYHVYYQQSGVGVGTQSTLLATTPDFVTFTRVGIALNSPALTYIGADGHTGYADVWRQGGLWYARSLMGGASYSMQALWVSSDGITFHPDPRPVGTSAGSVATPATTYLGLWRTFWWNGKPFAATSISTGVTGGGAPPTPAAIVPVDARMRNTIGPAMTLPLAGVLRVFVDNDGTAYAFVQTATSIYLGVLS